MKRDHQTRHISIPYKGHWLSINRYFRLVSAYEDKVLGLSEFGEIFEIVRNKTFPEFVDFVLDECTSNRYNGHWEPQHVHCEYCDIKYDMIGRVEHLENDLKYIAFRNNFTSALNSMSSKLHIHSSGGKRFEKPRKNISKLKNAKQKMEKTKRYFKMLNASQLIKLYQMYEVDFEMFDYSAEPYLINKEKEI